ncbi:CPBP family intramembrane glutamic endopeptidase [Tropicibacter oceani]|uniref:Type II CAAX endopeptidase family protein n=1 Tax=Tropicibacter oceani TaxID=3058420 RepID=A0ABY8QJM0_9RHOB|nr:type II CAAX endopeptidase family protein [Tropicibacter oceani]WGW04188.1 type II CAAX endopeptidase family protein [Tropicibacter oceani]
MNGYAPHERLVLHARRKPEIWRLMLGLMLIAIVMYALSRAFFAILQVVASEQTYFDVYSSIQTATTPSGLLVLLFLMGAMGIGTMVAAELVHQRPAATLFGPRRAFWGDFRRVLVAMAALTLALYALPPWGLIEGTTPNLPLGDWLRLLPLTLIALLIQTGSEELLFRGYLQSQLAARFQRPGVWLVLPSALFASLHYAPQMYGDNAIYVVLWAFAFGLAAADLTARSGTLGPAIALHLVNNFSAMALVSMQGDMSGLALYHLPFGPEDAGALGALLPIDLAVIGVSWLAARLALRR